MRVQLIHSHAEKTDTPHIVPALIAILAGFALVLLVGFAPLPAVHNAAHDTRHTATFPCH